MAGRRVETCQLCNQESCCPEHCCDWDTCQCNDCFQCTANKISTDYVDVTLPADHKYDDPTSVQNFQGKPPRKRSSLEP